MPCVLLMMMLSTQSLELMQERKLFDEKFIRLDTRRLCELTSAADALDMKPLVDLTSRALARMIEGKSAEEIRCERAFEALKHVYLLQLLLRLLSTALHLPLRHYSPHLYCFCQPGPACTAASSYCFGDERCLMHCRETFHLPDDLTEEE